MTEYIIIAALIAIAAIGVVGTVGNDIRRLFGYGTDALSGNTAVTVLDHEDWDRDLGTLSNFGQNNNSH